ncbi:hypothetical protein LOC67_19470 [Stieleria sp. JC731]|uniref:hypothetical protein n=1 Tax=Pirellulaceae TaxID=2691357 RepID=UPI001E3BFF91|nr:hypothetical protein [Stieleria sp. JC731]MCC9602735.1 hypothetical protein [Stieleria sp. JC731]
MDLWKFVFDNEYRQRADIESLRETSKTVRRDRMRQSRALKSQESRIEELENQVGELALLCRSMLTVLRENGSIDPTQFQETLSKIDLEDGVADGKITKDPPSDNQPIIPDLDAW